MPLNFNSLSPKVLKYCFLFPETFTNVTELHLQPIQQVFQNVL